MTEEKLEEMWKKLFKFKIVRIVQMTYKKGYLHFRYLSAEEHTDAFEMVIIGYNRVIQFYEVMLQNYPIDDPKIELMAQSGLILLITTLESYLESLFYSLCRYHTIGDINNKIFKKFLSNFDIKIKYNRSEVEKVRLTNYLPQKLNFQNKDLCRKAFQLFGIKINEVDTKLWEQIYNNENGYIQLRHGLIHAGPSYGLYKINRIDIESFEKIMLEIGRFLCLVDNKILEDYDVVAINRV